MRLSKSFWQTYKENPNDAEIPSHQLMMRAGLIHKAGAGLYNYLPFALRSIKKIESVIREELDKIGCQEILMTVVTPGELWQESGRWDKMGDLMLKFQDKNKKSLCISPTNEEAVVDIFRSTIKSYKQLPITLYQINTKFRDEIRPRFGLMRGREFTMKDAYSFHVDKKSLDEVYDQLFEAYSSILKRLGLKFIAVEADGGAMASGDAKTHEFQVLASSGEDTLVYIPDSNYAANIEKAQTKRAKLDFSFDKAQCQEVSTPGKSTIEDVASFLKIPAHHSLKALVYKCVYVTQKKEKLVLAFLLGDDQLNEVKLVNYTKADHIQAASDSELERAGFVKGYIGPFGLNNEIEVVFDSSIDPSAAYVVGACKKDFHRKNFIPQRDLATLNQADLRQAQSGDLALDGKSEVQITKGIEVGHIFQLGDKYTKALGVSVLDENGKAITPLMGCYGIGVTRILAACIEQNNDDKGIIWPAAVAPYQIHLVSISKSQEFEDIANGIYQKLQDSALEVLFDDRAKIGPGFKFKDADLLGLPIRVVLGERDYQSSGLIEVVERKTGAIHKVDKDGLVELIRKLLK